MKASRYNTVVRDGETWIHHNTLYGGTLAAGPEDHSVMSEILRHPAGPWKEPARAKPYYALLARNRFLVDDDLDELEICAQMFDRSNDERDTVSFTLMMSYACNFKCTYCFQRLTRELKGDDLLAPETFDRLVAFVKEKTEKVAHLRMVWMGGEPLMHAESIVTGAAKLKAAFADRPFRISHLVITNGYLLDAKMLATLQAALGTLTFQITIDGPPSVHDRQRPHEDGRGTFDKIIVNTENALAKGASVVIRVNVDQSTASELPDLLERFDRSAIATRRGIVSLARVDHSVLPEDRTPPEEYKSYARTEAKIYALCADRPYMNRPEIRHVAGCPGLGAREFMIDARGDIYRCPRYMEDRTYAVGTLASEPPVMRPAADSWQAWSPISQEKCRACALLPVCMGGCPFKAINGGEENRCGETPFLYKTLVRNRYRARIHLS